MATTLSDIVDARQLALTRLLVENVAAILTDHQLFTLLQAVSYQSPRAALAAILELVPPESQRPALLLSSVLTDRGLSLGSKEGVAILLAGYRELKEDATPLGTAADAIKALLGFGLPDAQAQVIVEALPEGQQILSRDVLVEALPYIIRSLGAGYKLLKP